MASKIICLNLVRTKHAYSSSSSLCRLFYFGGRHEKAVIASQQPRPWSSRSFSSLADLRSFPSLMLTPQEEGENVTDATTATATTEKTLNFRFLSLAAGAIGENMVENMADHVMKLKKKVPQPLLDAYCVGSSHGWLAYRYTNSDPNSDPFYLANVLSPTTNTSPKIIPLPSFTSHSDITAKVALSSAPNDEKYKCVVLLIDVLNADDDEYKDQLAFCRIGDSSWTILDSPLTHFSDVMYSKKNQLFYVLTSYTGDIEAWDLHSSSSPRRIETEIKYPYPPLSEDEQEIRADADGHYQYLVESPSGDILRIMRYDEGLEASFRFDVYKINFQRQKAEYLDNLGDTALFLGYNHSFALSVRDYPGLIPNSIYFAEDHFHSNMGTGTHYVGFDCGVYDLEDDTVQPLFPSHLNKNLEPLLWLAPNP